MLNTNSLKQVLSASSIEIASDLKAIPITSGHINHTYLITNAGEQFVLQELNTAVFKNLEVITTNILKLSEHLRQEAYPNEVLDLVAFKDGSYLYQEKWRLMKFIENSQTFLKVQSPEQAYEAAKFLGSFHSYLLRLEVTEVADSIPGFVDFSKRRSQYQKAMSLAEAPRLHKAKTDIDFLNQHQYILTNWLALLPEMPTRVIHADPKISNFLFDKKHPDQILALIDWDTLMRGPILYDFGDMVRSYTNLREEDDAELGNNFSLSNYKALEEGFLFHLKDKLAEKELTNLQLAAKVVIYVQAMRFLTDYLSGDVYYAIKYKEHNLDRTRSQLNLLRDLIHKIE